MSTDCTVCYVSDLGFLLPSVVSAASIRRFVPPHKADVSIFTLGVSSEIVERAERLLGPQGISVRRIDDHVLSAIDKDRLSTTLTPLATFGRFFMEDLLPRSCRRLVYLDGDVLCVRDPTALIEAVVPEGRFAAAEDTIFYRQTIGIGSTARKIRNYYSDLGLKSDAGYFNAGVFAVSRDTWKSVAQDAYLFFLHNTDICKSFDQSALNVVVGDRRLRLSAKWNFQTQMKIWQVDSLLDPHICHFNRYPKPWMGRSEPWTEIYEHYQAAVAFLAPLDLPLDTLSPEQTAQYNASTDRTYYYLRLPLASRAALRCMNFAHIEGKAWM